MRRIVVTPVAAQVWPRRQISGRLAPTCGRGCLILHAMVGAGQLIMGIVQIPRLLVPTSIPNLAGVGMVASNKLRLTSIFIYTSRDSCPVSTLGRRDLKRSGRVVHEGFQSLALKLSVHLLTGRLHGFEQMRSDGHAKLIWIFEASRVTSFLTLILTGCRAS